MVMNDSWIGRRSPSRRVRMMGGRAALWLGLMLFGWTHVAAQPGTTTPLQLLGAPESAHPVRVAIPRSAVKVFTYEGAPKTIEVTPDRIMVDYAVSRCEFERASGRLAARHTRLDGWTPPLTRPKPEPRLVGPGVINQWFEYDKPKPETVVAAHADFVGKRWQALQPADFLNSLTQNYTQSRKQWGTWSAILNRLNENSTVAATPAGGGAARRYTMRDGLASNIVTHLAPAGGTLWAACVDIYDHPKNQWGPGGLCRYDAAADRWERMETIKGHPVRWVTLLQAVGDELWVGFREGSGVDGDSISYGMGLYPGDYRPVAKSLALARLKGGAWEVFSRSPLDSGSDGRVYSSWGALPEPPSPPASNGMQKNDSPTTPSERLIKLMPHGGQIFIFSRSVLHAMGNWDVDMTGHCSLLDPSTGQWRVFELYRDIDADHIEDMTERNGELLVTTNRGVFRWRDDERKWQFLDPQSPLKNSAIGTLAELDGDLWVGYQKPAFGIVGEQGLSRYEERTGRWHWLPPRELGTSCPVLNLATLPDGSLWVLFKPRPYYGAAMEFSIYPRERVMRTPYLEGVGRYHRSGWQFPAALDGVTTATPRPGFGTPIQCMAAAAGKLFMADVYNVFMGPDPWKRIYQVSQPTPDHAIHLGLQPEAGGQALLITKETPYWSYRDDDTTAPQARYRPGDAKVEFKTVVVKKQARNESIRIKLEDGRVSIETGWTQLPTPNGGPWYLGGIANQDAYWSVTADRVFETPAAIWLANIGELIRVDRAWLNEQTSVTPAKPQS